MGTAIANFTAGMPALPADLAQYFEENENIAPKLTVPSLSYEGKTWTVSVDGNKKKLMGKNTEGDEIPLSIMRVVILAYNQRRGRAYYEGSYDPTKVSLPKCWSTNGEAPDDMVKDKQAALCKDCPNSAKGSKVTDAGNETTACSQHRMLVVIPTGRLDFTPLRLKIAITSDYDGRSPDHEAQGWYSFSKFMEMLRANGVNHSALISTKIKFDPNVAYPKLLFAKDDWLDEKKLRAVLPIMKSEGVQALLDQTFTPNGVDGIKSEAAAHIPQGVQMPRQEPPAKPKAAPAPKPAPVQAAPEPEDAVVDDGAFDMGEGTIEEQVAAPVVEPPKPTRTRAAAPKAQPAQQATAPTPPAAAPAADVPNNVQDLLAEWD